MRGPDLGGVGRWSRLVWGVLILVSSGMAIYQGSQGFSQALTFYGAAFLYGIGIVAALN